MNKFTILIPCYNEVQYIELVLVELLALYPDIPIVVVDNGSTDGSITIIERYQVMLVRETLKAKGRALRSGLQHVSTPYVILIDADHEYASSSIQRLMDVFKDQDAVVLGIRPRNKMLFRSKVANLIMNRMLNFLYQCNVVDCLTGLRIIKTALLEQTHSDGFEIETELNVLCLRNSLHIREVLIDYSPRLIGKKIKACDLIKLMKVAVQ